MIIGVATIVYRSLDLVSAVKMLIKFTDNIMLSPIYSSISEQELKELLNLKETYGLEYYVHGPLPASGWKFEELGYNQQLLESTLRLAERLESPFIVIHPTPRVQYHQALEILQEYYKAAEDRGITVAVENKPQQGDTWLAVDEDFERVLQDFPDIKFCVDTSHYFLSVPNSAALRDLLIRFKDSIAIMHIADTGAPSVAKHCEDLQLLPGFGDINWYVVSYGLRALNLRKVPLVLEVIYPYDISLGIRTIRHIISWY
ncbi:MAG: sugar phosphate isomerase/epimerase [bacterium]|nr:sugar phosphate isomerase/epimerase [bacterium]